MGRFGAGEGGGGSDPTWTTPPPPNRMTHICENIIFVCTTWSVNVLKCVRKQEFTSRYRMQAVVMWTQPLMKTSSR